GGRRGGGGAGGAWGGAGGGGGGGGGGEPQQVLPGEVALLEVEQEVRALDQRGRVIGGAGERPREGGDARETGRFTGRLRADAGRARDRRRRRGRISGPAHGGAPVERAGRLNPR